MHRPRWDVQPADCAMEVARLVYQSHAEFYSLFSADLPPLIEAIRCQLHEPDSELGITNYLTAGGRVVGVYSWYGAAEAEERKLVSLRMLLDVFEPSPTALAELRRLRQEIPAVDSHAAYLSRIAVAEGCRGAGFGQRLIQDFEEEALGQKHRLASLHVRRHNDRAVHFYRAAGYRLVSSEALAYLTMSKELKARLAAS
jgi:ribosomal protein S18 acetylase RimI-like enzyme